MLLADGYEGAVIGIGRQFGKELVVYDEAKCLEILVKRDGMSPEEAREYFEYNTAGSWVGDETPMFLERMTLEEIRDRTDERRVNRRYEYGTDNKQRTTDGSVEHVD
jgi:hypothetical protein